MSRRASAAIRFHNHASVGQPGSLMFTLLQPSFVRIGLAPRQPPSSGPPTHSANLRKAKGTYDEMEQSEGQAQATRQKLPVEDGPGPRVVAAPEEGERQHQVSQVDQRYPDREGAKPFTGCSGLGPLPNQPGHRKTHGTGHGRQAEAYPPPTALRSLGHVSETCREPVHAIKPAARATTWRQAESVSIQELGK